jgi:hyaluronan synthase
LITGQAKELRTETKPGIDLGSDSGSHYEGYYKQFQRDFPKFDSKTGRRWIIMKLSIITIVCALLVYSIYREIFVVDPLLGIYGLCVIFLIFTSFFFSYTKYKDPSLYYLKNKNDDDHNDNDNGNVNNITSTSRLNRQPLASIIIAAKNEPDLIGNAVEGCLRSTYQNIEICLVNDGSTDETGLRMDLIRKANPERVNVVHIAKNVGKRKAIVEAIKQGGIKGEIIILHDSDSIVEKSAIERLVSAFNDPDIGAVTCYSRPLNSDKNTLTKMQDTWYHGSFGIFKAMESSFGSVTCCSGVLSAYRLDAILPCLDAWSNDKFLGEEFRPGDDRQLTSYVIGGNKHYLGKQHRTWKACYCESAHVLTDVPSTFKKFINQQIRWKKSWARVFLFTAPFYYHDRPATATAIYYIQMILSFVGPFVTIRNLIILPMLGLYLPALMYLGGVLFIATLYAIDFRFHNPNSGNRWIYRLLLSLLNVFGLSLLIYYAIYTIKRNSWLTR